MGQSINTFSMSEALKYDLLCVGREEVFIWRVSVKLSCWCLVEHVRIRIVETLRGMELGNSADFGDGSELHNITESWRDRVICQSQKSVISKCSLSVVVIIITQWIHSFQFWEHDLSWPEESCQSPGPRQGYTAHHHQQHWLHSQNVCQTRGVYTLYRKDHNWYIRIVWGF